jgi:hypothetical protein
VISGGDMMSRLSLSAVGLALLLCGCVNGFEKYYKARIDVRTDPSYDSSYVMPTGKIPVYTTDDIKKDARALLAKGFIVIGESSFYMPDNRVNADQLQTQAKAVGAHLVLLKTAYKDTVTGAIPLTVPTTSTSYTTGTGTVYGAGGNATISGSAITNTYGTQTEMIPYSLSRSDFDTLYFAKAKIRFGTYTVNLTDKERQALQTNFAVRIDIVIENSAAFNANILPGDYLLSINDIPISSPATFVSTLKNVGGQDVTVHLVRNGAEIVKAVHMNP